MITKLGYFLVGMGLVNALAFPYVKDYQERNQAEIDDLLKQQRRLMGEHSEERRIHH